METNTMGIVLVTALIENFDDVKAAEKRADSRRGQSAASRSTTRASIPGRPTSRCPCD